MLIPNWLHQLATGISVPGLGSQLRRARAVARRRERELAHGLRRLECLEVRVQPDAQPSETEQKKTDDNNSSDLMKSLGGTAELPKTEEAKPDAAADDIMKSLGGTPAKAETKPATKTDAKTIPTKAMTAAEKAADDIERQLSGAK